MNPIEFKAELDALAALYDRKMPGAQSEAWWAKFRPFSIGEFRRAIALACEDSRSFPTWGQISKHLRPLESEAKQYEPNLDAARKAILARENMPDWEREYTLGCIEFCKRGPSVAALKSFAETMLSAYPELSDAAKAQWRRIALWHTDDPRELRDELQAHRERHANPIGAVRV